MNEKASVILFSGFVFHKSSMCVISCVKYAVSMASCLSLCFPTPAVQISITNISPWLTLCFLSVKRPWLAGNTCADRPKILRSVKWMCVSVCACVCVCMRSCTHAYVCMHDCVRRFRSFLHALIIQQVPVSSVQPSPSSAGWHSSLQSHSVKGQTVCVVFLFPPLSTSSVH